MVKINDDSEHNIQSAFVDWVLWQYRNDPTFFRPLFFAVPNGAFLGGRSPVTFQKLKREGFQQGVADLLYLQPRGEWSYLALELKTPKRKREKGRGLSDEQEEFLNAVGLAGGLPSVCYGLEEAIETFSLYMGLKARVIAELESVLQSRAPGD